jgi:hypothetical protein
VSGLRISWDAVPDATGYELFRAASASGPWTVQVNSGSGVDWNDDGLAQATTYHYAVRAINSAGSGPLSASASSATSALTWQSLSLTGVPSAVAGDVIWFDLHQAAAGNPLFLSIGAFVSGGGQSAYAFQGDDGAWTDISESPAPRLYANTGSLVSGISPAGTPTYWYQGPDLAIGQSQARAYSGTAWSVLGTSPAPSTSIGEYRYLYFLSDGTPRLLYQQNVYVSASSMYEQRIYLREFSGGAWTSPTGVSNPIAAPLTKTQNPLLRVAIGSAGEIHILLISTQDSTNYTAVYYRWDGALTGPETVAAANSSNVAAIAVNPATSQPYIIVEDPGTTSPRALSAYHRTESGWQLVGAAGSLSRITANNSSMGMDFAADGTLWAVTQTGATGLTAYRFATAWNHYAWTYSSTLYFQGMKLTKDGRLCLFADPTTSGVSIVVPYIATW